MTEHDDRTTGALTAPLSQSELSALAGRPVNDYVYFESDFDGDLHAVGIASL